MRLSEFSSILHDYWRRWQEDFAEPLPPFKVEATQRLLRVRLVRIGSGLNGGTLIYLEDLGRAQGEAQQIKLAAMGRLTASIAHEVRNPLSAINQAAQLLEEDGSVAPEGQRLLSMIRNNAKRIDRIVGEVLQLNRRDRQQPEVVTLGEFIESLIEEIVQAEQIPPGGVVIQCAGDLLVIFDRGHLNQIVWNLVRNAWQHCQKKDGSIHIVGAARIHGRCRNMRAFRRRPGHSGGACARRYSSRSSRRGRAARASACTSRENSRTPTARRWSCCPRRPGAHFRHDAETRRRAGRTSSSKGETPT